MSFSLMPGTATIRVRGPEIRLDDLTVAFDRKPAVHHLAGRFAPGSLTAVIGPNGAGKSTLVRTIAGVLRPAQGRVEQQPSGAIAYLPQHAEIDRQFPITVRDTVLLGFWRELGWGRAVTPAMHDSALRAIAAVGLEGLAGQAIGALSVGQMQRALFARMLVQDAPLILLDEPFAAIDEATISDLIAVIAAWHGEGRTVIAVLHDLNQVREHFPETLLLARSLVAWGPTAEVLTEANLRQARRQVQAGVGAFEAIA